MSSSHNGENGTVFWSDNSNNESGFNVYYRYTDLNSGETSVVYQKSVGPNTTSTQVPDIFLVATTTGFGWGVSAYNGAGESTITWQ